MKKPKKGTPTKKRRKPRKEHQQPKKPPVTQLTAIARDLLPQAAGQARKGRPRLLAVCARIILTARRMKLIADEKTIGGIQTHDLDESSGTDEKDFRLRNEDVINLIAESNAQTQPKALEEIQIEGDQS